MSLDEKSEKWIRHYKNRYPWVHDIIEQYGLDLSRYDLDKETARVVQPELNRSQFIEDVHFLKAFDEYVRARLPTNFSSVLEVGTGNWTYVYALAAFFRKYSTQASIIGIDNDPLFVNESRESVQSRNVEGVEAILGDMNSWQGKYDVVVSICLNLASGGYMRDPNRGIVPAEDFFYNIWKVISENGLFVMGMGYTSASESDARKALTPFFKDIISNQNPYNGGKSIYPIEYLFTAKPKLPQELNQS